MRGAALGLLPAGQRPAVIERGRPPRVGQRPTNTSHGAMPRASSSLIQDVKTPLLGHRYAVVVIKHFGHVGGLLVAQVVGSGKGAHLIGTAAAEA